MTDAKRKELQARLLALSGELSKKTPKRLEPSPGAQGEVTDEDEQALNEMLRSIASNRNRNDAALARRVELALEKLGERPEEYGVCEECGEDILLARLRAMPYVELCVECQGKRDGPKGLPTRRRATDFDG